MHPRTQVRRARQPCRSAHRRVLPLPSARPTVRCTPSRHLSTLSASPYGASNTRIISNSQESVTMYKNSFSEEHICLRPLALLLEVLPDVQLILTLISNRYVSKDIDHDKMAASYLRELNSFLDLVGPDRVLSSVFFGGGTPSLARPQTFEAILTHLRKHLAWAPDVEITMEANPTSVEAQKLRDFRAAGVNRISLGVQSLLPSDLRYLGRNHSDTDARAAIELALSMFPRVSFDLIYGRSAEQTASGWRQELKEALKMGTSHISLYSLTLEPGTKFHTDYSSKGSSPPKVTLPDPEVAAQLYEISVEEAEAAGLLQYEVSNFARPGHESRHNLAYWSGGDYIGIGPGAAGRLTIDGVRRSFLQLKLPERWHAAVAQHGRGSAQEQTLSDRENLQELLLSCLRTRWGLSSTLLEAFTGCASFREVLFQPKLAEFVEAGLLVLDLNGLRATRRGLMLLDTMLPLLLPPKRKR